MHRRNFLRTTASLLPVAATADDSAIPVVDAHIHLFDTTRPQGVPWPSKDNPKLYRPALPARYEAIAKPLGIVGAIEIECSPWLEDNQWVLDIAEKSPIIVGTVGDLEPGKPEFGKQLERFSRNRLFRGIRYGNLWGRDLGRELNRPEFIADLELLAQADLELDSANPTPELIGDLVRLTDQVPNLRLVVDHLPHLVEPSDPNRRRQYDSHLNELAKRPHVYVKISQVLQQVNNHIPLEVEFYKPRLDHLFELFGEDRLIYGSDWPNSDQTAPVPEEFNIVHQYFLGKGHRVAEKYFWRNSIAAYRWAKRTERQPETSIG